MSFCSSIFSYIFGLLSKISMTVQFFKKIQKKIQTQKKKKIPKWNLIYDEL